MDFFFPLTPEMRTTTSDCHFRGKTSGVSKLWTWQQMLFYCPWCTLFVHSALSLWWFCPWFPGLCLQLSTSGLSLSFYSFYWQSLCFSGFILFCFFFLYVSLYACQKLKKYTVNPLLLLLMKDSLIICSMFNSLAKCDSSINLLFWTTFGSLCIPTVVLVLNVLWAVELALQLWFH